VAISQGRASIPSKGAAATTNIMVAAPMHVWFEARIE
jgi:hypothetical protein